MKKPSLYFAIGTPLTTGHNAGKHHVKLCVTFLIRNNGKKEWKQRPYKTNLFCSQKEFEEANTEKKRYSTLVGDLRDAMIKVRDRASKIIDKYNITEQRAFESYFLSDYEADALSGHFKRKIDELEKAKKFSSKEKYNTTLVSLQKFFGDAVTFSDCTPDRLQEYEDDYIAQIRGAKTNRPKAKSLTSVGINMRNLRHIFNRAIKAGVVPVTLYPFGSGKYVIPEGGDDTKKFLSSDEKDGFIKWTHESDDINRLHDYIKFSYYAYGINLSDVARLKKSDVHSEYISINRQKTLGRKKKKRKLIIPKHPAMADIIARRGKRSLVPDDYVFPILDLNMDEETIFYKIRDLVDDVNRVLKMIGNDLNFEITPTSYTIRHTFSFQFMQLGGTTDELQDALAHGSSKTTESYKHGFSLERKKKFSEGL